MEVQPPTPLTISNYRVLFDRKADGFRASTASVDYWQGVLSMGFMYSSDAARGIPQWVVESRDLGRTWSEPVRFGPPLTNLAEQYQGVAFAGRTTRGTQIIAGTFVAQGVREGTEHEAADQVWRPGEALIGRREPEAAATVWQRYPTGAFLGEQYVYPGLTTRHGRIVLTIWGAAHKGENWRAGVLLSDDDGLSWRYREVAYEPDPAIRMNAKTPAGFNEETLFELLDGRLVSIVRGREHLGQSGPEQDVPFFFRSISDDGGETWSAPEMTNLAGTGAAFAGLVLPDGSMLLPSRVPTANRRGWMTPAEPGLFGLYLGRSFDQGKTWRTEAMLQRDPAGEPFDNYYNAMNGQFVAIAPGRWLYTFGHFDYPRDRHRVLALEVSIPQK